MLRYVLAAQAAPEEAGNLEDSACGTCGHESGWHLRSVRAMCQALDSADDRPAVVFWLEQYLDALNEGPRSKVRRFRFRRKDPGDQPRMRLFEISQIL